MLFKLALKNVISRKSSFVIVFFIAFAIMLLVVTNAVFDSTEHGVEQTFSSSFTGDVVIRPLSKVSLSLFGDETPVTGSLTEIPRVIPFNDIISYISSVPQISMFVPQVSGTALMENGGERILSSLFGVTGDSYIECMNSIKILEGTPYKLNEKGLMLSDFLASQLHAKVGDIIQFTVADGMTFRIRAVPLSAIYAYPVKNTTLDRIALIDASTLRALMDIADTTTSVENIEEDEKNLLDQDLMLDDLFSDASDVEPVIKEKVIEEKKEIVLEENKESTSWNFIICRLSDSKDTSTVIKKMNKTFKKNGWPVEAINWRNAAGNTAMYLYWLRLIFNVGILIVLAAGFIIVNNTLVINVLDRTHEIGTMRAVGASQLYISVQCMVETCLLSVSAGILGCVLGIFASKFLTNVNIVFTNNFLIQLFGDESLVTSVTLKNLYNSFLLSLFLGLLGWIYPVMIALKITPVQAMQGGK